jgi:hypothetical protein
MVVDQSGNGIQYFPQRLKVTRGFEYAFGRGNRRCSGSSVKPGRVAPEPL